MAMQVIADLYGCDDIINDITAIKNAAHTAIEYVGANIVEGLARKGYTVILNYNNSEKEAKSIQNTLNEENINIDICQADVSIHTEVTKLINYCINKYHKIDVLINNAGISQTKLLF